MPSAALTSNIDVAQVTLYVFWIFFAGLLYYLRQEDRREGYPLVSQNASNQIVENHAPIPRAKAFLLEHGRVELAPRPERPQTFHGVRTAPWEGAPLEPTGNPMLSGVGPAAWAERSHEPERLYGDSGLALIVPLRAAPELSLDRLGPEPRGMTVIGADGVVAGLIGEAWVDRSETTVRYLEVALAGAAAPRTVLLPMTLARVDGRRGEVRVASIMARQFADVPMLAHPDQISLLEEDQITAYYSSGHLFADPTRREPVL